MKCVDLQGNEVHVPMKQFLSSVVKGTFNNQFKGAYLSALDDALSNPQPVNSLKDVVAANWNAGYRPGRNTETYAEFSKQQLDKLNNWVARNTDDMSLLKALSDEPPSLLGKLSQRRAATQPDPVLQSFGSKPTP